MDSMTTATSTAATILIVDDAPLYQATLAAVVKKLGFVAEICGDGSIVIPRLNQDASGVAAILLDIYMPEIDGISTLGHIRHNWPNLAVIVISGSEDSDDKATVLELGAIGYIKKPFAPDAIEARLRSLLAMPKA